MPMSVTDRYTRSLTRLANSAATDLDVPTAQWRCGAANAHLAEDGGGSYLSADGGWSAGDLEGSLVCFRLIEAARPGS